MKLSHRMHAVVLPVLALMLSAAGSRTLIAQPDSIRGGRGDQRREGRPPNDRRPVVERLEARIDMVLRQRLQLTDDQFSKLQALNAKLEPERRAIRDDEMSTRKALREELQGTAPNDARVTELLDKLPLIERRRIALQEQEQKELAKFLQPSQRARYFGLRDEIRRKLDEQQRRRMGPPGDDPQGPPPFRAPKRGGVRPPG